MTPVEPSPVAAPCDRSSRAILILGWIATVTAVLMYVSYLDQIHRNLAGEKGSIVQPLATVVNCSLWCVYGMARRVRDWPIFLANLPGVVLGLVTLATAL